MYSKYDIPFQVRQTFKIKQSKVRKSKSKNPNKYIVITNLENNTKVRIAFLSGEAFERWTKILGKLAHTFEL